MTSLPAAHFYASVSKNLENFSVAILACNHGSGQIDSINDRRVSPMVKQQLHHGRLVVDHRFDERRSPVSFYEGVDACSPVEECFNDCGFCARIIRG
ncbi:MAG: hypothetical protein A3C53_02405 [Omnitrophica WOR_2 bacterium RIFCSPHIGHO2_02_FULL_68_15]|nr:MAG: hypothetical protein A3C53_02405 [Omnitrophica WOR_2 bacterium RIFCSPHIGHO2_02_FULL_68_15]